ncbi:MAG: choice-of-anchor D domain-containing protein [Bacteroidota bacterium]|nr:choice-of-anchor D domain-containing protein [Bacteroidota bacterium]
MKKLYAFTFICLLFVQFSFGQGVFNSLTSGAWNVASSWTLVSGTDSDGIPDSDDDVTVLNGHIISLPASVNGKNVTINSGGSIIGPNTGSSIFYLRVYGTTLTNNGTLGGTFQGTNLGFEPANSAGTVTLSGSGVCKISQVRSQSAAVNMNIIIDQDMKINRSWGRGIGFSAYQSTTSNGNTLTINTGRTVTLDSTADFHHGSTGIPVAGGNTTYIINGTLKTNGGQRFIIIPFNSAASVLTIEVNGVVDLGGRVFGQRASGQTVLGPVNLNINNGGVVKVSGVPADPEIDLFDVNTTLSGTGYIDIASWPFIFNPANYIKTTGTGGLKRNVASADITFPIGTSTNYNPVVMNNTGTADKFTVRVKSTFDNSPVDINKVVNRQWTIDEEVAGGSNASIILQWNLAEEASSFNRNVDLLVSRYTGTAWQGKSANLSGSDPYTAMAAGFNAFSNFIVESRPITTFQLSKGSINLGSVEVSGSKTDSVYVRNIGATTINVSSVVSDEPLYTVTPSSTTVPAGDSVKFKITFSPTATGAASGNITFTHDGGGSPHIVTVSGTGVFTAPVFEVNPASLAFGVIAIGKSKVDSVVVTNGGATNLVIDSVRSFNNNFSVNPSGPVTVLPAATQKFYVTFSPTAEAVLSGNLSFYNNTTTSPNVVGLTGTGLIMKTVLSNGTGGGDWSSTSTWQGAVLPSVVDSVVILGADSVYLLSDVLTGGLGVQTGGRLLLLDTLRVINSTVNGTIIASGAASASAIIPNGVMIFLNGSTYRHALPAGMIPVATWNAGSTCEVTGYTTGSKPGNPNQNFHYFIWNCASQAANIDMAWYNNTIGGNITVKNSGVSRFQMTSPSAGSPNVITINGNIDVEGGQFSSNGSSSAADITIHTYGNINATGGNFSISRGSGPTVAWYLHGNFSMSGGATTQNSKPVGATFIVAGITPQNITFSGMIFSGTVPVQVNNGAALNVSLSSNTYTAGGFEFTGNDGSVINMGTTVLRGSGAFTMNAGATLECAHAGGLDSTLSNTGGKNLGTGANFKFNGVSAQRTGIVLPATLNNLIISNPAGVTASASTTVNGMLSIMNGNFLSDANTITLGTSGILNEIAGQTVIGKVVTTRNVIQGVNNTFGGIGIEINAADAAPGSTNVERITGTAQTGNSKSSILRYFNIVPTINSGLNAALVFKYYDSELAGQDAGSLQLYKSLDNGSTWSGQGGIVNVSATTISLSGVNSFSRWTAADANNDLGFSIAMSLGWNMVSVPLTVEDYSKSVLFPTATSSAFAYETSYVTKTILENAVGYWLKFPTSQSVPISGAIRTSDSLIVRTGWNMIGSLSVPISITNVTRSPGVNLSSPFYGYQNGYSVATTIEPGRAYWIKVSADGKLYLNVSGKK